MAVNNSKVTLSNRTKKVNLFNNIAKNILLSFSMISVFTTITIIIILLVNSISFFKQVSIIEFLTSREWTPLFSNPSFGVVPLLLGTIIICAIGGMISLPIGLFTAIYLSEYAKPKIRNIIKPILEILSGIPSIVFGFFALTFITPIIRFIFPSTEIFNALSAGIAVGIMTIPLVASLSEDAIRAVPNSLRHASYALGATKYETSMKVLIKAAASGIIASFVLAISRAVGETMIVTVAAGARPNFTLNPLEGIQTMTAFIVQASQGDNPFGSIGYYALYAVGLGLFCITLLLNIISHKISEKYRKEY